MNPQEATLKQSLPSGESDTSQPEEAKVFINENEWLDTQRKLAEMQGKLSAYQEIELRLGNRMPEVQQAQPPPRPEFQYHSEEELQQALDAGDMRAYHKLTKHNTETKLKEEIWNLRATEIEPLKQTGSQALSDLSGRFASQGMEHLDIPDVKKTYEQRVNQLKATGQVVNAEVHKNVYEWAVGTNIAKVQEKIQQGFLRKQQETEANLPTAQPGRKAGPSTPEVPSAEEFFAPEALSLLTRKYPGLSPEQAADREYQRHGGFKSMYAKFYGPKPEEGGNKK